jgi:tetratricopeptide (TPR) repeat protein
MMNPQVRMIIKAFLTLGVLIILCCPIVGWGEVKEIIAEGTYNMGDGETPSVAESRALFQAKRIALEQAGTYVESYTQVKNFKLDRDEVGTLAAGIMEVTILDKKRTLVGGNLNFWVKIKALVSTDKLEDFARRIKEKTSSQDHKKITEAYEKTQRDIEELKKRYSQSKEEKGKKELELKIAEQEKIFQANELMDSCRSHFLRGTYNFALETCSRVVSLNPNHAQAYVYRGACYNNLGLYDQALEDLLKAIRLDPVVSPLAYYNLGLAYDEKKQFDKAIENYTLAIAKDPKYDVAYHNRGAAHLDKGIHFYNEKNYSRAIDEYTLAIDDFGNANALASYLLYAYQKDGNIPNACRARGLAYKEKGEYSKAIEDYSRAISINPNYSMAYNSRGVVYSMIGNREKAIADYRKACQLENEVGCKNLRDKGGR